MFKRIIYEDWVSYIPIISFWFTFSVFLAISLRAILMKKDKVRYMGDLPLGDEHSTTTKDKA